MARDHTRVEPVDDFICRCELIRLLRAAHVPEGSGEGCRPPWTAREIEASIVTNWRM
jgi:hypothetical protein